MNLVQEILEELHAETKWGNQGEQGDVSFPIYKNPTEKEYRTLLRHKEATKWYKQNNWKGVKYSIRSMEDRKGNVYVWPGTAMHVGVASHPHVKNVNGFDGITINHQEHYLGASGKIGYTNGSGRIHKSLAPFKHEDHKQDRRGMNFEDLK
jgi:hypothetical protein